MITSSSTELPGKTPKMDSDWTNNETYRAIPQMEVESPKVVSGFELGVWI